MLDIFDYPIHEHPIALTASGFIVACLGVFLVDPHGMPREARAPILAALGWRRRAAECLARLPIILFVFELFFAISWRPVYACQSTITFFAVFTAISRVKYKFIREPMVFSDFLHAADFFKYKKIFYVNAWMILFWIAALAYVFGTSALYWIFEPSLLPARHRALAILAAIALPLSPIVLMLLAKPVGNAAAALSRKTVLRTLNARSITARFGTFASIAYHFVAWFGVQRNLFMAEFAQALQNAWSELKGSDEEAPLLIFWQSESFIDLRHFGDDKLVLPTLDRLRTEAVQWGRMQNIFEGGYTIRTEFAVLSGLEPTDMDVDASYPYVMARHYADIAWPGKLKKDGWMTHFIHPFHKTFFVRHKALPVLGFRKLTMLDEFAHDAAVDGPYVPDMKLTRKVLDIAQALDDTQPALLFVASMANHGPWEPGRRPGMRDPIEIYRALLQEADAALGALVEGADRLQRPVWLAFYGDHAPLLKTFADPFPDPRTDYCIVPLAAARPGKAPARPAREEAPWNLFETVLFHMRQSSLERGRTEAAPAPQSAPQAAPLAPLPSAAQGPDHIA